MVLDMDELSEGHRKKYLDRGCGMLESYDDFPEMNEILDIANQVAPEEVHIRGWVPQSLKGLSYCRL